MGKTKWFLLALILMAAFSAGYWFRRPVAGTPRAPARQVLYYQDPMHPSYKSDKPGIAPDCGMQLEPVYASASGAEVALAPGALRIDSEKQRIIGIRTEKVAKTGESRTVRALGRVAADEGRIERVTALSNGVVRWVSPYAAGDIVQKDVVLAKYFVILREIYNAMQAYLVAMSALDQGVTSRQDKTVIDASRAQVRLQEELLQAYGLTEAQMQALSRTRQITRDIEFRSPVKGLILSRSVARGQTLDRGSELFRIADLTRVWVIAELFETDSALVRGAPARVRYQGRSYRASIGNAEQFDPVSRTLKVRLVVDNADYFLRPDMFVDVEFDVKGPGGISIPLDALVDSGRRKAVFVSTAEGVFEPREVITGQRYGDRVQILHGLEEGDSVVVAGLFLLDSESRLRVAAASSAPPKPRKKALSDPVCGMELNPANTAHKSVYQGSTFYFCSQDCQRKFEKSPAVYTAAQPAAPIESRP